MNAQIIKHLPADQAFSAIVESVNEALTDMKKDFFNSDVYKHHKPGSSFNYESCTDYLTFRYEARNLDDMLFAAKTGYLMEAIRILKDAGNKNFATEAMTIRLVNELLDGDYDKYKEITSKVTWLK